MKSLDLEQGLVSETKLAVKKQTKKKKYDRIDPYKTILLKVLIDWKIITFFFWKILWPEYPRCSFLYY